MKLHFFIKKTILDIVDFFYPPFKKIIPLQTFRYAACGGANTLFDILLFAVSYNFIFKKSNVDVGFYTFTATTASLLLSFIISFPTGFYLSRYVVFTQSALRKRVQLFRYFLIVVVCLFLNYLLLVFFVNYLGWYPTISKIFTTVIVITFSYLSQTYFSFQSRLQQSKNEADI